MTTDQKVRGSNPLGRASFSTKGIEYKVKTKLKKSHTFISKMLGFWLGPYLYFLGYKKTEPNTLIPGSRHFEPSSKLSHVNQIHKKFLTDTGWIESKNLNQSIKDCKPIPWTTYSFLYWFETKSVSDLTLVEFGAGASTLYFAKKFKTVISFETNQEWREAILNAGKDASNLECIDPCTDSHSQYANYNYNHLLEEDFLLFPEVKHEVVSGLNFHKIIDEIKKADYIFVDGGPRNLYLNIISKEAKDSSIIVVDNSENENLKEGKNKLLLNGFTEIPFYGLGPLNYSAWVTSIFFKETDLV